MTEALCTAPFAEDHPDGDQWSLHHSASGLSASPQLPQTTEMLLLCTHPFLNIFPHAKELYISTWHWDPWGPEVFPTNEYFCLLSWQVQVYFSASKLGDLGSEFKPTDLFYFMRILSNYIPLQTLTTKIPWPDMRKVRDKMSPLFLKITA